MIHRTPHHYEDPDRTGYCQRCSLPKSNTMQHPVPAVPLEGVAWPDPITLQGLSSDERDKQNIRAAIRHCARIYDKFSANEVRNALVNAGIEVKKKALIGAVFLSMTEEREIARTKKSVTSTDKGTHGKTIAVYTAGPCLPRLVAA